MIVAGRPSNLRYRPVAPVPGREMLDTTRQWRACALELVRWSVGTAVLKLPGPLARSPDEGTSPTWGTGHWYWYLSAPARGPQPPDFRGSAEVKLGRLTVRTLFVWLPC